ncbi:Inorganic pyrophosphatase [Buchnera aphidicola (Cinara kochiana kochiana)]|uniref:Inorganic pyrophosphatase n=1 Tax=Buchnera aphidicola (Cinara kochiana kochiana) TaxID=2518976 RepID=A0A451D574_9GAMM|nr:inorganic diphosphatase [Buchnera aphidicola]VFP80978.1 Inorganic pyrophosphatase [Buchnera aphidicola (Cinara kochiana kochiana)]
MKNSIQIPTGKNAPDDIYGIIEIPAFSSPIKYELHKSFQMLYVDRFIPTNMFYPCNYGFINHTLSLDGDPLDILIPSPYPLQPKSIIRCRPIGLLDMQDESGMDKKIIAVPHTKITQEYTNIHDIHQLSQLLKKQIIHFFENYKKLEKNKSVIINGWKDVEYAKLEIINSINRYKNTCCNK